MLLSAGQPIESVRANVKLAISGGQNEPRDAISGTIWALLTHPDQLALVRGGKARWIDVFEEYARWIAPIGMSPRRVARPWSYRGVDFEPEDRVFLMFGSANRDEACFADPDRFDITRDTQKSIAFGAGPHYCAGAFASRAMVADVALPGIFARLKGLRLDAAEPVRIGGWAFRGPAQFAGEVGCGLAPATPAPSPEPQPRALPRLLGLGLAVARRRMRMQRCQQAPGRRRTLPRPRDRRPPRWPATAC